MTGAVLPLATATWCDVRALLAAGITTAVYAVASTEQHGPHLPMATDTLIGSALCERVAAAPGGGRPYSTSIREVSPIGVLGDPRPARAERGARYLAAWVDLIATAVSSPSGR